MIKVGTCGFPVARSKLFPSVDVVETQKTFYTIVKESTLRKWRFEAPESLEFTVKALQIITHPAQSPTYRKLGNDVGNRENYGFFKPSSEVDRAMTITLESAFILKAKIIVFQTPASFKPTNKNIDNIINFFKKWRTSDLIFVWEPRGKWDGATVQKILAETGISHAVDPFKNKYLGGKIAYFRLHGRGKGYRYVYTNEDFRELRNLLPEDRNSYVMFNNTNMFNDAIRFKEFLRLNRFQTSSPES